MHSFIAITEPIVGKTYSLYGNSLSSDEYFCAISNITNELLTKTENEKSLLELIRKASMSKRFLKKVRSSDDNLVLRNILELLEHNFSHYTEMVNKHLDDLPLRKYFSKTMTLSQNQYHLYMLEIELVNRINKNIFNSCEVKFAFLPHCLHDLSKDCLSEPDEVDYLCKACSKDCSINEMSRLLRKHKIKPYLWREADLKKLFKGILKENKKLGVLGVACIPELVNGMRLCAKVNVPVVGVQLDANRCMRWWGEFHENTINITKLENLLIK